MFLLAASSWLHFVLGAIMFLTSVFLILLVLVQRGRGGGLTGALGGMGGQSAFGTKAGDVFTRITIVTAGVWILTCMLAIKLLDAPSYFGTETSGPATVESGVQPGDEQPGADTGTGAVTGTGAGAGTGTGTGTGTGSGAASPAPATGGTSGAAPAENTGTAGDK
jgi:preprotein translocase subunit SecG